ncbi:MAG TPA: Stk1 family PASTA domain-containing Ser/Thr kinase [Candidatus Limnocylindrales bacterium]
MPQIGQMLGDRYRLTEPLGEGGMATIYLGRDLKLDRDVAIKLLRSEYGRDEAFVARFRQEAYSAASLSHPNVVQVYDYGTDDAGPYIVMEYVDGQDLGEILRDRGFVPSAAAARIAMQVADGLAAAHAMGIVHRDVKPSNILVSVAGQVKVADFGIARALSEAQLTLPGQTLGSVRYLSPEQARGENVTPATDIYALGLVLSEMLSGRPVWGGDTAGAVAMARLTEDPPAPSSIRPDVNPALDGIVRRALARDPGQRFGSAGAFSDALGRFLSGLHAAVSSSAGVAGAAVVAGAAMTRPPEPTVVSPPPPAVGVTSGPPPAGPYDDDVDDDDDESRWAWVAALLGIGVLIAAGALIFFLLGGLGDGRGRESPSPSASADLVVVPNVIDLPVTEAKTAIEGVGLVMVIAPDVVTDAEKSTGTVVEQDPAADAELPPGGQVTVTVVTGPGDVPVPVLVGQTEAAAIALLVQDGLTPGAVTEDFSDKVPDGQVISQSPQAGIIVAAGTPVDFVVSTGPEPTVEPTAPPTPTPPPPPTPSPVADLTVGDYRCLAYSDAQTQIDADGFTVGTVEAPPGFDPSWPVGSQDPAPGSKEKPGSRIDLVVFDPASLPTCPPA